jgi:hypothetical protein
VIDIDEAQRLATEFLNERVRDFAAVVTRAEEFPDGWVFFWDSVQHQEAGLFTDQVGGNAPILVDRETRETRFTGTAHLPAHYISEYMNEKRHRADGSLGT